MRTTTSAPCILARPTASVVRILVRPTGSMVYIFVLAAIVMLTAGCPYGYQSSTTSASSSSVDATSSDAGEDQDAYDRGFQAGFALDDWYWDGYFDGYDTIDEWYVYYDDSEIPYVESPPYEAGFYDGVWYAYNDGYFVDYHYAFILGFSEGYDNAFWPDYLAFLAEDTHLEYLHGGWCDGYNDGFSEGRIFGANDYEQGLPFDWLDALRDYEYGTDLYFEEVAFGTGVWGPVILYEYGTNPHMTKESRPGRTRASLCIPTLRKTGPAKDLLEGHSLYREMTPDATLPLEVMPGESLRSDRNLRLDTTWINRLQAYQAAEKAACPATNTRARAFNKPQ